MSGLLEFDYQLMEWLNTDAFPFLDRIMWYFSEKLFWIPIYLLLLYALYKKYSTKVFVWVIVFLALSVLINDQVASGIFKNWVGRFRPSHDPLIQTKLHYSLEPNGQVYKGGKFGFYSSHAANYAGVAVLFILWMRPVKRWVAALCVLWVLLISYSRIYLGVHFPSDILMGLTMGTLVGFLCFFLWKKTVTKLYPNDTSLRTRAASI
jgi:undecaprenyl-diphosphatase